MRTENYRNRLFLTHIILKAIKRHGVHILCIGVCVPVTRLFVMTLKSFVLYFTLISKLLHCDIKHCINTKNDTILSKQKKQKINKCQMIMKNKEYYYIVLYYIILLIYLVCNSFNYSVPKLFYPGVPYTS